jgi:hypothetical protein
MLASGSLRHKVLRLNDGAIVSGVDAAWLQSKTATGIDARPS